MEKELLIIHLLLTTEGICFLTGNKGIIFKKKRRNINGNVVSGCVAPVRQVEGKMEVGQVVLLASTANISGRYGRWVSCPAVPSAFYSFQLHFQPPQASVTECKGFGARGSP